MGGVVGGRVCGLGDGDSAVQSPPTVTPGAGSYDDDDGGDVDDGGPCESKQQLVAMLLNRRRARVKVWRAMPVVQVKTERLGVHELRQNVVVHKGTGRQNTRVVNIPKVLKTSVNADDEVLYDDLRRVFENADTNHDGKVTVDELEDLLFALYLPSEVDIELVVRRFDRSHTGRISQADFIARVRCSYDEGHLPSKELKKLFKLYDTDGNGRLSGMEIVDLALDIMRHDPQCQMRLCKVFGIESMDQSIPFTDFIRGLGFPVAGETIALEQLQSHLSELWELYVPEIALNPSVIDNMALPAASPRRSSIY